MVINLRQVFNIVGEHKKLDFSIPIEELSHIHGYNFISPVKISGEVYNRAGVVTMKFSAEFTLKIVCDRCLKEIERLYSFDFEHIVVTSLNTDDDDYIVAEGECVDMDKVAVSDLLLQLPSKMLCKEDCKGLCSTCGCNLNETECNCEK